MKTTKCMVNTPMIRQVTILLAHFIFTASLVHAIEFKKVDVEAIGAVSETQAKKNRDNWVRLRQNGGVINTTRTVHVCAKIYDYGQMMSFILYGTDSEPEEGACWILKSGTEVKLVSGPICNKANEICKFRTSGILNSFSKGFYMSIYAARPK